ncbi:hypothetical protein [Paenibacillus sp. JCM 10914]|uniref:hypothetical protein n=1 Tax=Paenibacillus sp. JCM 10914 TaxID=1236974 RepID=UPI00056278D0|nr:hypothetical protein [Paenibacillus sp. JCM 10914]
MSLSFLVGANGEGGEEEAGEWINCLRRYGPHPDIGNLFYWRKEDLTPEEIVEKALNYKPLIL